MCSWGLRYRTQILGQQCSFQLSLTSSTTTQVRESSCPSSFSLFTSPFAFSMVATAMSVTFSPPAGAELAMKPSTRMPASLRMLWRWNIFSLASDTKGRMSSAFLPLSNTR
jgi:hypothetical protein